MKYLLDTADKNEINTWKNIIVGVTTNPKLVKTSNANIRELASQFEDLKFFYQIRSEDEILAGPEKYDIVYKIPMIYPDGYNLLKKLYTLGYRICATMVYDLNQLNFAAECGADYSIILVAKNDNQNFLEEAVEFKRKNELKIKLIAASFRTKNDILRAIKSGVDYATIPPKIMKLVFHNLQTVEEYGTTYS